MKIILTVLILTVSLLASGITVRQTKNHTIAVKQMIILIENIKILIEYKCTDIKEIFNQLSKSNNYYLLKFIDIYKTDFNNNIVSRNINYENFDKDDGDLINGFFSMLGKSDLQGQISNCELYKTLFENKLSTLEAQEKLKCKSTSTLIVGIGLILSIIII